MSVVPESDRVVISVRNLSKQFDHVVAVNNVSLDIHAGEVVGLVGDNGAGKSTLLKLISGVLTAKTGTISLTGKSLDDLGPRARRDLGIEVIYQDMALVNDLEIWENIFLGRHLRTRFGIIDRRRMIDEAAKLLKRLGSTKLSPGTLVGFLSGGEKKAVAISRAINFNTHLIIMDEPTAALAVFEIRKVLDLIGALKAEGHTVIFVSHNLGEIFSVTDRIIVMHRGEIGGIRSTKSTNESEIIHLMMGLKVEKET